MCVVAAIGRPGRRHVRRCVRFVSRRVLPLIACAGLGWWLMASALMMRGYGGELKDHHHPHRQSQSKERVFIAANFHNSEAVLRLVGPELLTLAAELIGRANVAVSIYENGICSLAWIYNLWISSSRAFYNIASLLL